MKIQIFEFNPVCEHTFVLYDDTKECIIIDPGCFFKEEKEKLAEFIASNDLIVKRLINTHLHFDHVFGCNFVSETYNVPLEANKEDEFLLEQFPAQLRMFGFFNYAEPLPKIGKYLTEEDIIEFGNQKLDILHIPGHSPGSLVYYNKAQNSLIAGDVLFRDGIGRTDLAKGNNEQLISGIKNKLFTLPPETVVYPGHGPATTIEYEKRNNSYLF
jgi:glyoxylase-like metal-dependent hydrolase (beta-lactamase superfamily II)